MLFSIDLRLSTDGLYTVGCPSNDRCASLISALPAPAAQTSAGGTACSLLPAVGFAAAQASPSSTALVLSAQHGQCGQRPTSIGRVLYVERLTAGSTATTQFFCDLPSKSLWQAYWAANLSGRGELHSAGRENGLSVMRNGLYIFKTHQTGN